MKRIDAHADGACSNNGNEGIGGWACIVTNGTKEKILSGGELNTTNNRMELVSVIEAINAFKGLPITHENYSFRIFSDSAYVVNGINKRWIKKWISNGWKNVNKKPVANRDLWETLNSLDKEIDFQIIWNKGHAGNTYNERCDKLAKAEVIKLKEGLK